jgi:hypothetical protein
VPRPLKKPLKIVIWVAVFAACAGVGAFVASRSDPFPPGVEDPGLHTTPSSPTQAASTAWDLSMFVKSEHVLHEGGACRSDWKVSGTVTVQPNGQATGVADADLASPASCDFAQSQVQTKAIRLVIAGTLAHESLTLSFSEAGRTPVGSQDLGGFTNTLHFLHPNLHFANGVPQGRAGSAAARSDGDLGTYSSKGTLRLSAQ